MISGKERTALQVVHTLFESGTLGGMTDGQLLERFVTRSDKVSESAFAALVERHGPMVLRVCRSILSDSHAAQDAFQATFLVLVQKSDSLRVRDALGPWLHQVALRVASCARAAAARRRKHEQRVAEMTNFSVRGRPPEDFAPILHKELDALPERYRSVVILCCLEGLTHAQAARQLGCPVGTLQSRLARGRQRLRDRLIRRGIAPSGVLLGAMTSAQVADGALPAGLLHSTVRAVTRFGHGETWIKAAASADAVRLSHEVARGMLMSKLKLASAVLVAIVALGVGAYFQTRGVAAPEGSETKPVVPDSLAQGKRHDSGTPVHPENLDFGPLHVGAIGEAGAYFLLEPENEWGELSAKVVPPPFLKVKSLQIREQTRHEKQVRLIEVGLSIDTSRAGDYSGRVRVEYGDDRVELPVSARVLPNNPALTKVLVVTPTFGEISADSKYYRPWFELVETANLDVSYLDPSHQGLRVESRELDRQGNFVLPEWFKQYDVVLVLDGGPIYVGSDAWALRSYVRSGGRLILGASTAMYDTVTKTNKILKPFGLEMTEQDITKGRSRDNKRWAPFLIEEDSIHHDPLTKGVETVAFRRATPIRVTEHGRGEILLHDPDNPAQGFAAVSRNGGEVIVLGPALLFSWLGEEEVECDNALFLRNLLTKRRR